MTQRLPPIVADDASHEEFVRLICAYQGRIYAFVFTLLPNRSEAEELLQQVSVVLWRKFDTFDRSGDFVRWACGVAYNEVRHHLRSLDRERRAMNEALLERLRDMRLDCAGELDERRDLLVGCLEQLSEKDRRLIDCYYYRGNVTAEDVARTVRRSTQAVYKALQRIRLALHQCIERGGSEEECP